MESNCRKNWRLGLPCPPAQVPTELECIAGQGHASGHSQTAKVNSGSIVFGAEHPAAPALIPGYNTLAPLIKTARDPALSLTALSGIEPTGQVMVEVPLVLNNTSFTASQVLSGWRIGYADRYVRGDHAEPVEHSSALRRAFEVLRQAGAQLIAVDVQRADDDPQSPMRPRNDIDDLVTRYRLDALMSDDLGTAFRRACRSGCASVSEPQEGGMKLWFFTARWSQDTLTTLVQAYRQHSSCAPGTQG